MVLVNTLTVEAINTALIALQRGQSIVVGGEKETTVNNITISNSGGSGGNGLDFTPQINALDKRVGLLEKAEEVLREENERQNERLEILEGLGISDFTFDEVTRELSIELENGDTFDTTITSESFSMSVDNGELIIKIGNNEQRIPLPSGVQADWTETDSTDPSFIKNKIPIWITQGSADDNMSPVDAVTDGEMRPVTSNAVADAIAGQSGTSAEINIGEVAWIKVCSIDNWDRGDVLELYFQNNWNTVGSSARKITITKGTMGSGGNFASWVNVTEEASDPQTVLSEIQICGANSTSASDKVFVYVKYNKTTSNTIRMAYKSVGFNPPTIYMTKETPSGYALNVNYALHNKGVYVNGEGLATETNLAYTNQYSGYCAENANLQIHKVKNGILYINMTFLFSSALTFSSGNVFLVMDRVLTSNAIINVAINGIPYFGYIRAISITQAGKSDIVLRPAETSIVISAGKEVSINCAIPVQ